MTGAFRTFVLSSLIGVSTAVSAWVAAVVIVGRDDVFRLHAVDVTVGWQSVLGATTATLVFLVITALRNSVEPVLTMIAGTASFLLLYQSRNLPFVESRRMLSSGSTEYWTVVAAMLAIFGVLLVSLRIARNPGD